MTPASRRDFLQHASAAAVAVALGLTTTEARQAGITVLSGNGARVAVAELARQFEQKTGRTVRLKSKMRPMPGEYNVEIVAEGGAEYVVVVASRITGVKGVQLIGRIPRELQTWIGFAGGVCSTAREPQGARDLLRFFTAPPAARVLEAAGIEPFVE